MSQTKTLIKTNRQRLRRFKTLAALSCCKDVRFNPRNSLSLCPVWREQFCLMVCYPSACLQSKHEACVWPRHLAYVEEESLPYYLSTAYGFRTATATSLRYITALPTYNYKTKHTLIQPNYWAIRLWFSWHVGHAPRRDFIIWKQTIVENKIKKHKFRKSHLKCVGCYMTLKL